MLYLPISRGWLLSRTAQHIYLGCAVLTFALVGTIIGTHLALSVIGGNALTSEARILVNFLLLPEIAGAALLWVAMWYFWFGFDRSHYAKKAFWFVLLFFLAPFGTLLYYFVTYRRDVSSTDSVAPQMIRQA
ncbi:MAG TPA: hypothetical protein VGM18_00610 [Candidatus Sulfotelmatobacter sp.]|jgi:hypothetical protein